MKIFSRFVLPLAACALVLSGCTDSVTEPDLETSSSATFTGAVDLDIAGSGSRADVLVSDIPGARHMIVELQGFVETIRGEKRVSAKVRVPFESDQRLPSIGVYRLNDTGEVAAEGRVTYKANSFTGSTANYVFDVRAASVTLTQTENGLVSGELSLIGVPETTERINTLGERELDSVQEEVFVRASFENVSARFVGLEID